MLQESAKVDKRKNLPHAFKKGMPRPPNSGRKKGSVNRETIRRLQELQEIKASGKTPMQFFADILSNEDAPLDLRFRAAEQMAPYMHPKLSSIEARNGGKSHEDRLAEMRKLLDDDGSKGPLLPPPQGGDDQGEGGGG